MEKSLKKRYSVTHVFVTLRERLGQSPQSQPLRTTTSYNDNMNFVKANQKKTPKTYHVLHLAVLLLLFACSAEPLPKEQQLNADITQLENLVKEKDTGGILDYLHPQFKTANGWSRIDLKRMLHIRFLRHKNIHLFYQVKNINWQNDDQVQVEIVAAMAGTDISSLTQIANSRADLVKFTADFKKHDGHYKIVNISWQPAYPNDFL